MSQALDIFERCYHVSYCRPLHGPVFFMDLVLDKEGCHYSTDLHSVQPTLVAVFDRGIQSTHTVPQIEKVSVTPPTWIDISLLNIHIYNVIDKLTVYLPMFTEHYTFKSFLISSILNIISTAAVRIIHTIYMCSLFSNLLKILVHSWQAVLAGDSSVGSCWPPRAPSRPIERENV